MSPPGPDRISPGAPLSEKKKQWRTPVQNENEASTDKQGILSTKFSVFRDRKSYAILRNTERSKTLVGSMGYQQLIWELEKSEHFLIKSSWEYRMSMSCRAGNNVISLQPARRQFSARSLYQFSYLHLNMKGVISLFLLIKLRHIYWV